MKFKDVVDLTTGMPVDHKYLGMRIDPETIERFRTGGPVPVPLPSDFDPKIYLRLHADVASAGVDPAQHYLSYGRREGRAYKGPT